MRIKDYSSNRRLKNCLTWLFVSVGIIYITSFVCLDRGTTVTQMSILGLAGGALMLISCVVFLVWVYRANRNIHRLNISPVTSVRFTPGWSVGWFFVPIMHLFRPYQVIAEIWRISVPDYGIEQGQSSKEVSTSPLVKLWWVINIFQQIFAVVLFIAGPDVNWVVFTTRILGIAWIVLTVWLIRGVTQNQEEKYELISSANQSS